jgi:hypothetical protein
MTRPGRPSSGNARQTEAAEELKAAGLKPAESKRFLKGKVRPEELSVRGIAKRAERVRAALQQRLIDHADVAAIWEGIGRAVDEKMAAAIPKWFSGFEVSAMRYPDGMLPDV